MKINKYYIYIKQLFFLRNKNNNMESNANTSDQVYVILFCLQLDILS